MESKIEDSKRNCEGCLFLLHCEFDGKGWNLPLCSIDFRDGRKVNTPCKERRQQ